MAETNGTNLSKELESIVIDFRMYTFYKLSTTALTLFRQYIRIYRIHLAHTFRFLVALLHTSSPRM